MSELPLPDECYICARPAADTRDHVVPRNLFATPPDNLITLPAHSACNQGLSKDEEFLRAFLLARSYEHPEAKRLWDERFMTRLTEGFRRGLVNRIRTASVGTEAGLYLGDVEILLAEKSRINPILMKMVRGLFRHHNMGRLDGVIWDTYLDPKTILPELLPYSTARSLGSGVLFYRYAVASDDPREGAWWFLFYQQVLFLVLTSLAPRFVESPHLG